MQIYWHRTMNEGVFDRDTKKPILQRWYPDIHPRKIIKPPSTVRLWAKTPFVDIETPLSKNGLEFKLPKYCRSMEWIYCSSSWPHRDISFETYMFLTLNVVSSHILGVDYSERNTVYDIDLVPGSIFLLDPTYLHWLRHHVEVLQNTKTYPWIGLQLVLHRERMDEALPWGLDLLTQLTHNKTLDDLLGVWEGEEDTEEEGVG